MQLIHELSWLWKGIAIIALVSAIVLIAAFKLHKEVMLSRLVDTFFSRTSWTMLLYAENHSISVA